jgi:hypothetical protein
MLLGELGSTIPIAAVGWDKGRRRSSGVGMG